MSDVPPLPGADGVEGPHADRPLVTGGAPLAAAEAAVVLLHGRGGTAEGMVNLASADLYRHGVALFAPAAARDRWFPYAADAPLSRNEPHVASALQAVGAAVTDAAGHVGLDRVLLVGFSQGGCLAAEFAVRHPRAYGGVAVLAGSLLGPDERLRSGPGGPGSFDGTPALFGVGAADERVSRERVRATADRFRALDAAVTERVYEGGHEILDPELAAVRAMVDGLLDDG